MGDNGKNSHPAVAEKQESYSHILKYTGLFGGVQGLGILVGIVRNKLVALILGPQGMGLISLFNSTVKLVGDSTNFGLSVSAVKNLSEAFDYGDERRIGETVGLVRLLSLLTGLFGMLVCMVLSPLLSRFTFSWHGHTLHFVCLAPAVALLAVTGGETAILKSARQLRHLASVAVYTMLLTLLVSVPIYYFFGNSGIVPSLVLLALVQMLVTISCSYRLYPPHLFLRIPHLRVQTIGMLRLGIAFVLAGILGSGAEFLIRSYLSNVAQVDMVGLYNAGYMLTMTYVGMVFSAMETDYFPRLSGMPQLGADFNQTVNRQIEVMLLLVSPLLVAFTVGLPLLLPLLYSGQFLPATGMVRLVILAMYFRAVVLPVQYVPLARGASGSYLLLEAIYDLLLVALIVVLFHLFGLSGAGLGILLATVVDTVVSILYVRWRFSYRPSSNVLLYLLLQLPLGILAYFSTLFSDPLMYWGAGVLLTFVSLAATIAILKSKTHLWAAMVKKLKEHIPSTTSSP